MFAIIYKYFLLIYSIDNDPKKNKRKTTLILIIRKNLNIRSENRSIPSRDHSSKSMFCGDYSRFLNVLVGLQQHYYVNLVISLKELKGSQISNNLLITPLSCHDHVTGTEQ